MAASTNGLSIRDADVTKWSSGSTKISMIEVCNRYGIDVINDHRNRFFWNIHQSKNVLMTEELLDWLGFTGKHYGEKKAAIAHLLSHNPYIEYTEVADVKDSGKRHYVFAANDFETLMMLARTDKISELRELFSTLKEIMVKYCHYEIWYESQADLREKTLFAKIDELKQLLLEQRQPTPSSRDSETAVEPSAEKQITVKQQCDEYADKVSAMLRSIGSERERDRDRERRDQQRLGLFRTSNQDAPEWYVARRQTDSWRETECKLERRGMRLVRYWDDVPRSVDIGSILKRRVKQLSWYPRHRLLRAQYKPYLGMLEPFAEDVVDDIFVCNAITDILTQ